MSSNIHLLSIYYSQEILTDVNYHRMFSDVQTSLTLISRGHRFPPLLESVVVVLSEVLGWKTSSPTLEAIRPDHLPDHPDCETLLEPAELAPVPPLLVHGAVLVCQADVLAGLLSSLNSSPKEGLASLAGSHSVVLTWGVVSTNGTRVNYHRTPSTVQI